MAWHEMEYRLILSTCPDLESAEALAEALIEEGLAACVSIVPAALSVYRWQGKIVKEREHLLLIKSREDVYPDLEEAIRSRHPYEVPEVIGIPVSDGLGSYLGWIDEQLEKKR